MLAFLGRAGVAGAQTGRPQPEPSAEPPSAPAPTPPPVVSPRPQLVHVPPPQAAPINSAPQPPPAVAAAPLTEERGFYASLALGVGGTFGLSPFSPGLGANLAVGYAPTPSVGIGAFVHYNQTEIDVAPIDEEGAGVLAGPEARLFLGQDLLRAWVSVGLGFGGGEVEDNDEDALLKAHEATLGPTPVLGFGVEARVAERLRLGLQVRWAMLQVSKGCVVFEGFDDDYYDYAATERDCDEDVDDEPDAVFLGVTITYATRLPTR